MNRRLAVALILVPIVAALSYAAALHWQFTDLETKPKNVAFLWPGLIAGVVFEALVLVPLLLLLRRLRLKGFVVFVSLGLLLWAALSFSIYASLMPLRDALQTTGPTMLFGAVMVIVFGALAVWRADALPLHRADAFQQASLASSRRPCQTLTGIEMWLCVKPLVVGFAAAMATLSVCFVIAQIIFASVSPASRGRIGMEIYLVGAMLMLFIPAFAAGFFTKRFGVMYGVVLAGIPIVLFSLVNGGCSFSVLSHVVSSGGRRWSSWPSCFCTQACLLTIQ